MVTIEIRIETLDKRLVWDLFDNLGQLSEGVSRPIPGNATLLLGRTKVQKSIGSPEVIELLLGFGASVSGSLVANFLYDKIKNRATGIVIDNVRIDMDRGEITRIIIGRISNHAQRSPEKGTLKNKGRK